MEQYIKIKAKNEDGDLLGIFKLSIDFNFSTESMEAISEMNKEMILESSEFNLPSNASLVLHNVPTVYEYDNSTPIQFIKGRDKINIMLLEEMKYLLSFERGEAYKDDYEVFHSLLKFTDEVLDIFPVSPYAGNLLFGSYVGKSYFDIYSNGKPIFSIPFEVRSRKLDYQSQYAAMIGDISKYSQNLIYESSSPLHQPFESDPSSESSRYEDFMLLEYLFKDENLPSAMEYLSRNLYSALRDTVEEVPTSFASNVNPNDLADVFSNSQNRYRSSDESSTWYERTNGYIPLRVNETKYIDSIDIPENRFYKSFLEALEYSIGKMLEKTKEGIYIHDKLLNYKETLNAYLSQSYFKEISMMDYLPLNSQILQKKEGYRDILEYYLMMEMGFILNWDEITDEFRGNEKKVFELYEYWCYFKLVEILDSLSSSHIVFDDIFKTGYDDRDNITMILRKDQSVKFEIDGMEVELMYNTGFSSYKNKFKSYSVNLRPDYSIIVHAPGGRHMIHFDAKYKLNINDESFKNEDIVKMHAYKDALLGTVGAYVLYPGEESKLFYRDSDGIESVGAFPLSPGEDRENREALSDFIYSMIRDLS